MPVWKNVASQLGGLAKHVAQAVVKEPFEVVENAVGAGDSHSNENQAMEAVEQGSQGQQQNTGDDPNQPKGFKSQQDYQKYQQLSGNKDQMEMAILRKRLFAEYGLNTDVEAGMQQARQEFAQKEEERKKVVERKKEEEKWIIEQKKKEEMDVKAATESASPENKAWGAG